ncbi:YvrJ family protein [Sutcliffiella horikoshii]|uniref:YvrJ family protein n=1 Tax=Sutcliffiella horikoshii TaxID=79883 RepID=A0A5D4S767_9BACI|nr:YvrJ family protein [Sutcliffiella horikoshii]TYS58401.1 YvrJ family protein [Sutcliffiella horikoshii]
MEMPLIVTILGNFGFPVMIAIYLLIRFEKRIENLTEAITRLQQAMKNKL